MPELGPYGSVRGARSNSRPYRESGWQSVKTALMTHSVLPCVTFSTQHFTLSASARTIETCYSAPRRSRFNRPARCQHQPHRRCWNQPRLENAQDERPDGAKEIREFVKE